METLNLKFNASQEEDWNEIINHFHDPELLYFYIKQIYKIKDIKKLLTEVPENKKDAVGSIFKLEVFRATMQYVEEFIMYFLAYIDGYENIGEKLIKTKTTKEVKVFLKYLRDNKQNEFSQKNKYVDFKELLIELFNYNSLRESEEYKKSKDEFEEAILESVKIIENILINIAEYYLSHLKVYNAIKHGTRVFPLIQNKLELGKKSLIDTPKEAIIIICKEDNSTKSSPYRLILPPEYLIEKAFTITEKTHIIFKCIRDNIRNELIKSGKEPTPFFKTNSRENNSEKKYLRGISGNNIFIIESPDDFETNDKPFHTLNAYKIVLKGKTVYFKTKYEKESSLEYPFLIESNAYSSSELEFTFINSIEFTFNLYDISIEQYLNLLNLANLQKSDKLKKVIYVNDLTNREFGKASINNLNLPNIPESENMNYLHFLNKLEKATGELIPFPRFTSKKQDQIIDKNIDKNLTKVKAKEILANLKSDTSKIICSLITAKVIDQNGKEILSKTFDPIPQELFKISFEDAEEENHFKREIYEVPGKSIIIKKNIDEIPANIIEKIDLFINNEIEEFPEFKDANLPIFELKAVINYKKPIFWYKEHFISLIFRPINSYEYSNYIQKILNEIK